MGVAPRYTLLKLLRLLSLLKLFKLLYTALTVACMPCCPYVLLGKVRTLLEWADELILQNVGLVDC